MSSIPVVKLHVDQDVKVFNSSFENILLEEDRNVGHIQSCKEAIYQLKNSLSNLNQKLEEDLQDDLSNR